MKALFGRAPNLPWWRLMSMTAAEIAAYNRSFMMEVEMSDNKIKIIDTLADDWDLTSAVAVYKPTWNAAIEAAAKIADVYGHGNITNIKIRELKK